MTFQDTGPADSVNSGDTVREADSVKNSLQTGQQLDVTDAILRQGSHDLRFFAEHAEPSSEQVLQGSTRRKRKKPPAVPRPKGAFIFFSVQFRARYKRRHPHANLTEMTKAAGGAWKAMSDEEKKPFVEMATQDKERYAKDKLDHCMENDGGAQKKKKGVFLYFFKHFKRQFDRQPSGKKLSMPELSKEAGKAWRRLPAEEKAKYADMAKEDSAHITPEGGFQTMVVAKDRDTPRGSAAAPAPAPAAASRGPSSPGNMNAGQMPNPLEVYQKQLHEQIHDLMGTLKRFHQQQAPIERTLSLQMYQANLSPFIPQSLLDSLPAGTGRAALLSHPYRTIESSHPVLLPRPRRQRSSETILLKGKVLD